MNEDEQNIMNIEQEDSKTSNSSNQQQNSTKTVLSESQRNIILCSDTPIGPNPVLIQNAFSNMDNLTTTTTTTGANTDYYNQQDPNQLSFPPILQANPNIGGLFDQQVQQNLDPNNLNNQPTNFSDAIVNLLLQQNFGGNFPNYQQNQQFQVPKIEEQPPSSSQSQNSPQIDEQATRKRKRTTENDEDLEKDDDSEYGKSKKPTISSARKTKKFVRGKESLPSSIFTDAGNHHQTLNAFSIPQPQPQPIPMRITSEQSSILQSMQHFDQSQNSQYRMPSSDELHHFGITQNSQNSQILNSATPGSVVLNPSFLNNSQQQQQQQPQNPSSGFHSLLPDSPFGRTPTSSFSFSSPSSSAFNGYFNAGSQE